MDSIDDRKLEKAFETDDKHKSEMILSWGMGAQYWTEYLKRANTFSARIMGLDVSNLEKTVHSGTKNDITDFYFYRALYILFMFPIERLYLFVCKVFNI